VEQLEALYAALLRLSALTPEEQSTVLQGLLDAHVYRSGVPPRSVSLISRADGRVARLKSVVAS